MIQVSTDALAECLSGAVGPVARFSVMGSADSGAALSVVSVGLDCRAASYANTSVPSSPMPPWYVPVDTILRAVSLRASDKPIALSCDDGKLLVRHGEFSMRVPLVEGESFEMVPVPPPGPAWQRDASFVERLQRVATIVQQDERQGILLEWDGRVATLVGMSRGHQLHESTWACGLPGSGRIAFSRSAADEVMGVKGLQQWTVQDGSLYFGAALPDKGVSRALRVSQVRDGYPRDWRDLPNRDQFDLTCSFVPGELLAALKVVGAVLTRDESEVMLSAAQQVGPDGVVFEVRGKSLRKATAVEKVIGRTTRAAAWEGRVNVRDLQVTLQKFSSSNSVVVSFGRRLMILEDREGAGRAFLSLLY